MLTELQGKAGKLCSEARSGKRHCPLMVRSTSEDVVTGHLVQALKAINPRWWLPGLLNRALGQHRFDSQVYRRLRIEPWVNFPPYPRELLGYDEGSTQVDIVLTWENIPTTVFIEAKYASGVSSKTANKGSGDQPTDQLVRNIRVGLNACGYFGGDELFESKPRDFVMLLLSPVRGHSLVGRYRCESSLRKAIPSSDRLIGLPRAPFVGDIGYCDVREVLQSGSRFMTRAERQVVDALLTYLSFKLQARPHRASSRTTNFTMLD